MDMYVGNYLSNMEDGAWIIGGVLPSREIDELARRGELVVSKHEKITKRHADGRSPY